jgi:tetratricopeptide (TPR) repeat protein
MRQYEKSKYHFTQALQLENLSREVVARGQNDLGVLLLEMKEYEEAEELLTTSLAIREEAQLEDAASTSMLGLSEVYLARGRSKDAVELLTRCKAITDKFQTKQKQVRLLQLLARAYSACGKYEEATQAYEQYNSLLRDAKSEQERRIFKLKNEQIEKQRKVIADKHSQLMATFDEVRRLKINRKSIYFSWMTVILLVLISEIFLDPWIEHLSYDNFISLSVKVLIACLFKPIDGMYEKILWDRAMGKVA